MATGRLQIKLKRLHPTQKEYEIVTNYVYLFDQLGLNNTFKAIIYKAKDATVK